MLYHSLAFFSLLFMSATARAQAAAATECTQIYPLPTGICYDLCTNPPSTCQEMPDSCCCVPVEIIEPCVTKTITVTATPTTTGVCKIFCPINPPLCSEDPGLCCCQENVITTTTVEYTGPTQTIVLSE